MNRGQLLAIVVLTLIGGTFSWGELSMSWATELSVAQLNANAGDSVTIPIEIRDVPGMLSLSFTLEYDPDSLTVDDVTKGDLIPNFLMVHNLIRPGELRVVMAAAFEVVGSGVVVEIQGSVSPKAPGGGEIPLRLIDVRLNDGALPIEVKDGGILLAGSVAVNPRSKFTLLWAQLKRPH